MNARDLYEIKKKFPRLSASIIARNSQNEPAIHAVVAAKRECNTHPTLGKDVSPQPASGKALVAVVTLIACRPRLLDDDNSVGGFKHLRDLIARTVGIDDGDKRIRWEYGQVRTDGKPGTIIRIDLA